MLNKSESGFVRIKDRIPYHGKGIDELIGAIRRLFSDPANKYAQKIVFEVGAPHIYVEKLVPEAEAEEVPKLSLHDVLRTIEMEEWDTAHNDKTSAQKLWDMFEVVQERGLQVAVVIAGNKNKFQKWMGVRINHMKPTVFGTPFQLLGELPEDVFVVCGAQTRIADVEDIRFAVKGTL